MSNSKNIHLVIFGIGKVGSTLINQINEVRNSIWESQRINLTIPIITNSRIAFFDHEGISNSWKTDFEQFSVPYKIEDIFRFVKSKEYDNLIAIDVTSSTDFVQYYIPLVQNGFHIVTANKIANTLHYEFYESLRQVLKNNNKSFLYETNVGAGLPIIETIQKFCDSGEKINRIRGVFSGSLSYIFNRFSEEQVSFSKSLNEASEFGLTEPDPREDLSGNDVARKLLILARELGIKKEIQDVNVENLIPHKLNGKTTLNQFKSKIHELNKSFEKRKSKLSDDKVLRYIGELDLNKNSLEVKLVEEQKESPVGQLKGADSIFEIYSESYKDSPLVIQGAGAGKNVTARGLLSDVIKVSKQLN